MIFCEKDVIETTNNDDMHKAVVMQNAGAGENETLLARRAVAEIQAEQHAHALEYE